MDPLSPSRVNVLAPNMDGPPPHVPALFASEALYLVLRRLLHKDFPGQRWYLSELALEVDLYSRSIELAIARLTKANLLWSQVKGKRRYIQIRDDKVTHQTIVKLRALIPPSIE